MIVVNGMDVDCRTVLPAVMSGWSIRVQYTPVEVIRGPGGSCVDGGVVITADYIFMLWSFFIVSCICSLNYKEVVMAPLEKECCYP